MLAINGELLSISIKHDFSQYLARLKSLIILKTMIAIREKMLRVNHNDIEDFTEFSHDRNPLHIDPDYARKTPFGDCVVYGILGILKILNQILAKEEKLGIFLESIQYKFHSPIRENQAYKLIKVAANEESWQLFNDEQLLVELKLKYVPSSLGEVTKAANSISYPHQAANPSNIDLVNFTYEEDYALDTESWDNFLKRHLNLARIPLEQLTCLIWTSYCIGMKSPGRQALYMGGKIDFSRDMIDHAVPAYADRNYRSSQIKCSISTHNWDSGTGNLVLVGEVKAEDGVIAQVNLDSLKRPDSVVISMESLESDWGEIPANHWLQGKVCLVTGGSRGLGSTIAKTLALFGAIVAINYRSSDDEAQVVLQDIQDNGGKAFLCRGDLTEPGICQKIVDAIVKKYGGLDLVISNAHPFIDYVPFNNLDFEQFQHAVMTPLRMSYEVSQAVINELQNRRGMMVTISSIYAQKPEIGFSGYSSAKNAVEGLIRSLAVEFPAVRQVIYRPSKFLSDQTVTNFSQIHLQNPLEVVKNLWRGLDRVQSENTNPLILDRSLVKEFTNTLSEELTVVEAAKAKIAITATFTAESLETSLNFWIQELDIPFQVDFAPYNQVFQELLNPSSLLSGNQDGINVVLIRLEDWIRDEKDPNLDNLQNKIKRNLQDLVMALQGATKNSKTPYLVYLCPNSPAIETNEEWKDFWQEMSAYLSSQLAEVEGVYLTTTQELAAMYPVENYYDEQGDKRGHIPFTTEYFTALATAIARKLYTLKSSPHKVIVLDCDNTLWQGVCGEDGAMGVKITPAYEALQKFMVEQSQQGMLLCLCSKNVESDAIEVFKRRPEMPIKLEHLVAWRINWQPKSANLKSLAEELNLGLDSFIFIDDNPVECSEVQASCPEVLTLQLPQATETIPRFLNHVWAFDRLKVTEADKQRTTQYKQNAERERLKSQTVNFEQFLAELELNIAISEMQPEQLPRVSQLTQRTNQFNATTIRRSEAEIQQFCRSGECLVVEVSDRFGDYGLVGVVLFKIDNPVLKVDTFLLSCRVLGRGVEHQILAKLGEIASQQNLDRIDFPYIPSPKNQPLLNFIEAVGSKFKQESDDGYIFSFPVDYAQSLTYQPEITEQKSTKITPVVSKTNLAQQSSKGDRLSHIANQFYDTQSILQVMETQAPLQRPHISETYIPPKNDTEKQLTNIWAQVLRLEKVGINDNYFDLGGTSVLAVSIFTQIDTIFAKNLPITTLIEAPTVAKLAQIITKTTDTNTPWSSLVPIRPNGHKTPLFFVHGGFGDVLGLTNLARHLNSDHSFYALRGIGLDGIQELPDSVEEIATRFIAEIKTVQPQGPYILGGQCSGGTIAFEMAQQLKARGEEIALLALLDTPYPQLENYFATRVRFYESNPPLLYSKKDPIYYFFNLLRYRWKIAYHSKKLLDLTAAEKKAYVLEYVNKGLGLVSKKRSPKIVSNQTKTQSQKSVANIKPTVNPNSPKQAWIRQRFFESFIKALQNYQPQSYDGKIDYFLPILNSYAAIAEPNKLKTYLPHLKPVKAFPKLLFGWNEYVTKDMEIHEFESTHLGMIREPMVKNLATKLNECLKRSNC